jgi:hypothetical protein
MAETPYENAATDQAMKSNAPTRCTLRTEQSMVVTIRAIRMLFRLFRLFRLFQLLLSVVASLIKEQEKQKNRFCWPATIGCTRLNVLPIPYPSAAPQRPYLNSPLKGIKRPQIDIIGMPALAPCNLPRNICLGRPQTSDYSW